ncbi:hypothetical protein K0M31_009511 [Melipona bicolor]|uniref:Uncharacterized protein n=1 Tax=Melipona bicolor TaxID=60889 RepID=A0AA40FN84_9HYME|nr:hypothetical protein K0M31_009511 [Melipona bicolor]
MLGTRGLTRLQGNLEILIFHGISTTASSQRSRLLGNCRCATRNTHFGKDILRQKFVSPVNCATATVCVLPTCFRGFPANYVTRRYKTRREQFTHSLASARNCTATRNGKARPIEGAPSGVVALTGLFLGNVTTSPLSPVQDHVATIPGILLSGVCCAISDASYAVQRLSTGIIITENQGPTPLR